MREMVRHERVQGRDIAVFDGLAPAEEVQRLAVAFRRLSFTRTESAKPELAEFLHWVCEMPLENLPRISLGSLTEKAIASLRPQERYEPYRTYTNFAAFGDMLFTHVDALPDKRELTALWFVCETWDPEWGGETVFFDDQGDAQVAVSPRPGRLILFDGAIRHAGRPPSRICYAPRFTFAIKLRAVQTEAPEDGVR